MGIEIFTFGPLEPEKMRFKDGELSNNNSKCVRFCHDFKSWVAIFKL